MLFPRKKYFILTPSSDANPILKLDVYRLQSYEQFISTENNINLKQKNLTYFFANIKKKTISATTHSPGSCHIHSKHARVGYAKGWLTLWRHITRDRRENKKMLAAKRRQKGKSKIR